MEKKNIALFIGKIGGGGAERAVSRLSHILSEYYHVYVIIYSDVSDTYSIDTEVIDLGEKKRSVIARAFNAAKEIDSFVHDNDIRLVISFCELPNIINSFFVHSAKRILSIRAHLDRRQLHDLISWITYPALSLALRKADGIWALTHEQKELLIKRMGIKGERIFAIGNIYDIDNIRNSLDNKQSKDDRIDKFVDDDTAVAVGRLIKSKNYGEMIRLLSVVKRGHPSAKLLILGKGPDNKRLSKLIGSLDLNDSVMLGGSVKDPFSYMRRASIYISTTIYEGFPNSLVEAMAIGLPVIHSDCPTGPREILSDDKAETEGRTEHVDYCDYGILTPIIRSSDKRKAERDRKEVASVWLRLLQDKELRQDYCKRSETGARRFDVSNLVNMYVEMIKTVMDAP